MNYFKFEYIWLDGYKPVASIRSKTKVIHMESFDGDATKLPKWSFDGSSTRQAEGHFSDCVLMPKRAYLDPGRENAYLVICEVYNPDGSPHPTNSRHEIDEKEASDYWIGFEQEYVLMGTNGRPIGFPEGGYPEPQGPYYCAVGYQNAVGRKIVEEHFDICLKAGIKITGINAEVMLGQWEYQCFSIDALKACDDLIISRYLLYRITEEYKVIAELHPKPIKGDWNGSGMHTNFSFPYMKEVGGKEYFMKFLDKFGEYHDEHITEYGAYNEERLTGAHETASISEYSYGVSDRGASIRIPSYTPEHDWKGYLEDRRPASNADPYKIIAKILKTSAIAHKAAISK
jgi:glutamine synthetase